ncbi:unnamed protein product [Prorocentrum cordatum]|uniref:RNA 3'-terminal phosphate cyclase domain-containing protein n=1 Tax=Prorocentrum cordatum TaxID=2364126 RepID=A0ABN9QC17_9DINO|nr:unnamed protein product [Polarella glacialis]
MPAAPSGTAPLRYRGSNWLRQRLCLSTVSGRPVVITDIRPRDEEPGLRDFEAQSLLRSRTEDRGALGVLAIQAGSLEGSADLERLLVTTSADLPLTSGYVL